MRTSHVRNAFVALAILALAGCAGDASRELATNAQVRDRIMGTIASNGLLAQTMTERLLATDSLRTRVVNTVLANDAAAQYVIARIGRNPAAVEYVLQVAASDSAGRAHLMTLLQGVQIALKASRK